MSHMDNKQLAEAYITDKTIERTQRYLLDGRKYADLSDDELTDQWVWTLRQLAATAFTQEHYWESLVDLESEAGLRRIATPKHQVQPELALLGKYVERWQREGRPDPQILAELAELRERLSRLKH